MVACTKLCEVNAADARKYVARIKSCKLEQERAKKVVKEMARPYTKLAPATKTGHQDAIALAKSSSGRTEEKI